jgi:uncharacterized protein (DUF1501 family)
MKLKLDSPTRRRLLKALTAAGFVAAVERQTALAQNAPDYKALLTVFLQGGNDGDNTVIRLDSAGYAAYNKVRSLASGLNIAQSKLLPIQPSNVSTALGLHPSLTYFKRQFDSKQLAIISNMGLMVKPNTRDGLLAGREATPVNLFSHSDQELQLQSTDAKGNLRTGWGGRLADRLELLDPANAFPVLTSINGLKAFTSGNTSIPLALPTTPFFELFWAGTSQLTLARDAAVNEVIANMDVDNVYMLTVKLLAEEGLAASSVVKPILQNAASVVAPLFANLSSDLSRQLATVAMMLEGRAQTGLKRQVFFVNQSGYDTHGGQAQTHANLLTDLDQALDAFDKALTRLQIKNNLTTLVYSEFGRSFKPSAGQGTDHGWGNFAFALGGAVKGGQVYGSLVTQTLNGVDDYGNEGRWIPTTSIEQFAQPALTWMGVGEADLPYILPNLASFVRGKTNYV